jgi:hypothetical protein
VRFSAMLGMFQRKEGEPHFKELAKSSHFSKSELKHMHNRFMAICDTEIMLLQKRQFLQQPELMFRPMTGIAFNKETEGSPGAGITFETYVKILSAFSPKASIDEKRACKLAS